MATAGEVFKRITMGYELPAVRRLLRLVGIHLKLEIAKAAEAKHPGSLFWQDISSSANWRWDGSDAILAGASHYSAGFKHTGGPITAPGKGPFSRNAQYLTIPIANETKGKNVKDLRKGSWFFGKSKKGNLIIFAKNKINKRWDKSMKAFRRMMGPKPLFVLKKSVTHNPDPWFPDDNKQAAAVERAGNAWFFQEHGG